jgi:predicted ATPase
VTEKLIVKNFAGIKDLEIEVKKLNILIGPQASGKSICAKLLFYFKNFVWEILATVENEQAKDDLDSNYIEKFEEYFSPESWGNGSFSIRYEFNNIFIEITKTKNKDEGLILTYSELFNQVLELLQKTMKNVEQKIEEERFQHELFRDAYYIKGFLGGTLTAFLISLKAKEILASQLFIPAGRSFFATLLSNIFSFLYRNNSLDPFLGNFGSYYQSIKRVRNTYNSNREVGKEIKKLIEEILCGEYIHDKGRDFIETSDGRRIPISNSSSGQQETLPLMVVLSVLRRRISSKQQSGQTVYIEEPEAHLFPDAQRKIVELIATIFNSRKDNLQFFITTHSPYILTAINNLLEAGQLYEKADPKVLPELEKILPRFKALNVSDVAAYELSDGTARSIIADETGLIDAGAIDAVSEELAIEFGKLLDLE